MASATAKHTYRLIRRSPNYHYFWVESETNRLVIGDHSCDDRYDEPGHPASCDDGILYVDMDRINEAGGLRMEIDSKDNFWRWCPTIRKNGEDSGHTALGEREMVWLATRLNVPITLRGKYYTVVTHPSAWKEIK